MTHEDAAEELRRLQVDSMQLEMNARLRTTNTLLATTTAVAGALVALLVRFDGEAASRIAAMIAVVGIAASLVSGALALSFSHRAAAMLEFQSRAYHPDRQEPWWWAQPVFLFSNAQVWSFIVATLATVVVAGLLTGLI